MDFKNLDPSKINLSEVAEDVGKGAIDAGEQSINVSQEAGENVSNTANEAGNEINKIVDQINELKGQLETKVNELSNQIQQEVGKINLEEIKNKIDELAGLPGKLQNVYDKIKYYSDN